MFTIVRKEELAQETYLFEIEAPRLAKSALPGQFLIVKMTEKSERIPLTISDYDVEKGTIIIVFKAIGKSTRIMAEYNVGDKFADVVGPLGKPSEFVHLTDEERKNKRFVFVGGGVGCSAYLYAEEGESYFESVAIPVYADFRLTGGSKRVTPYMDTKVGCDVNGFDLYAGIEFGANIRSASGSHGDSWWIGVKSDCVDFEAQTIGLTVGKSF